MARSTGHFVTLAELFEQYEPAVVRFHLLRSHYRSVADFSGDGLESSRQGLARLREALLASRQRGGDAEARVDDALEELRRAFAAAMDDDLNTPQAIAALFDGARLVNRAVTDGSADPGWAAAAAELLSDALEGVLGVAAAAPADDDELVDALVTVLLDQREQARLARDFGTADAIRERLAAIGIVVEDTADGSRWKRG